MKPELRRYYKRSRKLILTRYHKLKDENKKVCDLMFTYNGRVRSKGTAPPRLTKNQYI